MRTVRYLSLAAALAWCAAPGWATTGDPGPGLAEPVAVTMDVAPYAEITAVGGLALTLDQSTAPTRTNAATTNVAVLSNTDFKINFDITPLAYTGANGDAVTHNVAAGTGAPVNNVLQYDVQLNDGLTLLADADAAVVQPGTGHATDGGGVRSFSTANQVFGTYTLTLRAAVTYGSDWWKLQATGGGAGAKVAAYGSTITMTLVSD